MGKLKHKKARDIINKSPVVQFNSLKRIIGNSNYTKQLVQNLLKQKKIHRLAKGCYTKHENISLAVFCFQPAYLGLQDALSFHELWGQETIPIIVSAQKIRPGIRKIMGQNVLLRRIDKKYLFGYRLEKTGEFYLPYSNIEKTFIDMIYFKENISDEVLSNIRRSINRSILKKLLKKYPERFRKTILNKL